MAKVLLRQWEILKLVPRLPRKIGTREITSHLSNRGFSASQRSVQRDIAQLRQWFPDLTSDGDKDIPGWSWQRESAVHDFPGLDPAIALTFKLAEQFLEPLIPPTVLNELTPYFSRASEVLKQVDEEGFEEWVDRVRIVPRNQPLIPAVISPGVLHTVYEALLSRKQFRGRYRRRGGDEAEYDFHPLGLIFRNSVVYLVASVWDYEDVRHYALHRFKQSELLKADARDPNGFNLDDHIASGVTEYAEVENKQIKLVARFRKEAVLHLEETPLSEDQALKELADGWVELKATVLSSWQLRWWLLGFGDQVEVVRPKSVRQEFQSIVKEMNVLYQS